MSGTQKRFKFVEVRSPSKRQLQLTRKCEAAARAHVTKEFHRNIRLQRVERLAAVQSSSGNVRHADASRAMKREESTGKADEDGDTNIKQEPDDFNSTILADLSPQSSVSSYRRDPFSSLPLDDSPPLQDLVLDFAANNTWPDTVPSRRNDLPVNPVIPAWMQSARDFPVVLNAFLYASSLQMSSVRGGRDISKDAALTRFHYYQKSIALVNKSIKELDGPPSDALIMAVCCLAVHGKANTEQLPEIHPQSPLARQQFLHVYGRIENDKKHLIGLIGLIARKGGVENMETYGMSETIAL